MRTPRQRTIRSLVILPLAALLFGAAVSVAVAWWPGFRGLDAWSDTGRWIVRPGAEPIAVTYLTQHHGFQLAEHRRLDRPHGRIGSMQMEVALRNVRALPQHRTRPAVPDWAVLPAEFIGADGRVSVHELHVYGFGWPRVCLTGRDEMVDRVSPPHAQLVGFIRIAESSKRQHLLPTRVHWPGLLFNTLVFGGPMLLLGAVVLPIAGLARRRARLRRGACPACGYDLRGGGDPRTDDRPCPECGRVRA